MNCYSKGVLKDIYTRRIGSTPLSVPLKYDIIGIQSQIYRLVDALILEFQQCYNKLVVMLSDPPREYGKVPSLVL